MNEQAYVDPARPPHCSVPLTTPRLSSDEAGQIATLFKALAHPARVQLMNLLVGSEHEVCVYDLTMAMGLAQSTVSHHLKQLVGSGLLNREQRGIWAYYSVNRDAMRNLGVVVELGETVAEGIG
ncbi:metalloregulator ArsR/SmtB family transcription factor [Lentzea sp. BCCO 10_0061]|uniref:Metalloregulator ArsR/SmtB family transcription factor n=1 Tax=Lentzea sokolovensis TaxID=3095429 RepID=A0ABU4URU9_9PSEU|nr:metalloregulator ArsR/SmtB family transcription factor [Lentzea sp. BCCO 10_0061]MDX8141528.1 metalloregulator ArsR/SmtB family transcription factor [Lentzea sp. BCCO 10_0061]